MNMDIDPLEHAEYFVVREREEDSQNEAGI